MKLTIRPLELKEANALVASTHRHHKPVLSHRFSIGVYDEEGTLRGAAIVGRPVSREYNPKEVLEVTRLVTDGAPNACSKLYAAAARIGKELGYRRIQTYTLDSETGVTLKAAGWVFEAVTRGRDWVRSDGAKRRTDQPNCNKHRWARALS